MNQLQDRVSAIKQQLLRLNLFPISDPAKHAAALQKCHADYQKLRADFLLHKFAGLMPLSLPISILPESSACPTYEKSNSPLEPKLEP